MEVWDQDDCALESDFETHTLDEGTTAGDADESKLAIWLAFLLASLQKKHYIPNAAISTLLKILVVFFTVLSSIHPGLTAIARALPKTLYSLQMLLSIKSEVFHRYVSCPSCNAVYTYENCIDHSSRGTKSSRRCTHIPQYSKKKSACGAELLRSVCTPTGKKFLYPYKFYCYLPLKTSLQRLLKNANFVQKCEEWRNNDTSEEVLSDVYDGRIWKEFSSYDGKPFLSAPHTYGLMMNVDWFKPFKHIEYSVGAIYLTIMNLPRAIRFRQENVILVGLMPGPSEPSLNINTYLKPLVDELLNFLDGVPIEVCAKGVQNVRCALLCLACDIPACRKVAGFLSHNAKLGCTRCYKEFGGEEYYGGFDRSKWAPRNNEQHRRNVDKICQSKNNRTRTQLESKYGCRYSVLLDLPYFDPVRMSIIDPMHNLFLGTAKRVLKKVWLERNIIKKIITRQYKQLSMKLLYHQILVGFHAKYVVHFLPSQQISSKIGLTFSHFLHYQLF